MKNCAVLMWRQMSRKKRRRRSRPAADRAVVNVNRRIKLLFGEEYGIHVYSKEGIGTDVIVELPLVRDGDRQEDGDEKRTSSDIAC